MSVLVEDFTNPFNIYVNGVAYYTCAYLNGQANYNNSALSCTIANSVNSNTVVTGDITVLFVFNTGGSGSKVDLTCAASFNVGGTTKII